MRARIRTLLGGSIIVWATALAFAGTAAQDSAVTKVADGGLYSKAQADGAKARYVKVCAECHAFSEAAKKRPNDLALGGDEFLKRWDGRTLDELITLIVMTMPNDGSAVVSEPEAVDLVAYILQQNGFPAGPAPLSKENASRTLTTPKK
jgi:mono/diheme cytochrome c family protein